MNAPTTLEDRVRRGLQAAADALPEVPLVPPASGDGSPAARTSRRRRRLTGRPGPLAAAAAVLVAVAGAVAIAQTGGDDDPSDVRAASPGDVGQGEQANGQVPGRAVVVNPDDGTSTSELRTYGSHGAQTGTVDLAPLKSVQSASSDLDGGWVACGTTDEGAPVIDNATVEQLNERLIQAQAEDDRAEIAQIEEEIAELRAQADEGAQGTGRTTTTVPATTTTAGPQAPSDDVMAATEDEIWGGWADQFMWFPAEGDPVVLATPTTPYCMGDAVQVVDAPEGPTLIYPTPGLAEAPAMHALVLTTGQDRVLNLPIDLPANTTATSAWSATSGRIADIGDDGELRLFDLATGESLPVAAIDLSWAGDIAVAPDANSVAALIVPRRPSAPVDVVVYDLATGDERFRAPLDGSLEMGQLSYDGATLAIGDFDDPDRDSREILVIDVATGDSHTIDAHGVVL